MEFEFIKSKVFKFHSFLHLQEPIILENDTLPSTSKAKILSKIQSLKNNLSFYKNNSLSNESKYSMSIETLIKKDLEITNTIKIAQKSISEKLEKFETNLEEIESNMEFPSILLSFAQIISPSLSAPMNYNHIDNIATSMPFPSDFEIEMSMLAYKYKNYVHKCKLPEIQILNRNSVIEIDKKNIIGYDQVELIVITSDNSNISYTLDGTLPTYLIGQQIYYNEDNFQGHIRISDKEKYVPFKCIAHKPDFDESEIVEKTIIFDKSKFDHIVSNNNANEVVRPSLEIGFDNISLIDDTPNPYTPNPYFMTPTYTPFRTPSRIENEEINTLKTSTGDMKKEKNK